MDKQTYDTSSRATPGSRLALELRLALRDLRGGLASQARDAGEEEPPQADGEDQIAVKRMLQRDREK